jgi:L-2-hydroxyglutarate oxidase
VKQSRYDLAVIGAGILGLATARELVKRYPASRVLVLEKERAPARHQTGRNSGVIHSGLYYAPGSSKARLCVLGRRMLLEFCEEHGVSVDLCGKVVVATEDSELAQLEVLLGRGSANGVEGLRVLDQDAIREIEPAVRGLRALWVPTAGIVDYRAVAAALTATLEENHVEIRYEAEVIGLSVGADSVTLRTTGGEVSAGRVVACGGLHSDRIARMAGAPSYPRIVPFRGDYYILHPSRRSIIRGLVYPVPDPRFPFLGVHFTRRIDGEVWLGPNAVLAFAREGYGRADIDLGDLSDTLGYAGFRSLARKHWRTGLGELVRDYWKPSFLAALRRYVPELTSEDLLPGPSGVRAQAVDTSGRLVDDFAYDAIGPLLNVRNAPSPAATSSLALAREFVDRLDARSP